MLGTKQWITLERKRYQKSLTRYWWKDDLEEQTSFDRKEGKAESIFLNEKVLNSQVRMQSCIHSLSLRLSLKCAKSKAVFVPKLKGKGNWENEHRGTVDFLYNFVKKAMQLSNSNDILDQIRNWFFFTRFSLIDSFEIELQEKTKNLVSSKVEFVAL